MAWSDLDKPTEKPDDNGKHAEEMRALGTAAKKAFAVDDQRPLRDFLLARAHTVSFRPGVDPADVAFREGQRSLALQLLKLAGEVK